MKYLKTYEDKIKDEPQVGDYVLLRTGRGSNPGYFDGQYGRITKINIVASSWKEDIYEIKIGYDTFRFYKNEIIYWSKNLEDLEIYINSNKYNL